MPTPKVGEKNMNINLPMELYDRAKKYADKKYVPVAVYIRMAIAEAVARDEKEE